MRVESNVLVSVPCILRGEDTDVDIMLRGMEIDVPTHRPRTPLGEVRTIYLIAPVQHKDL